MYDATKSVYIHNHLSTQHCLCQPAWLIISRLIYAIQKLYCCSGDYAIIAGLDYFLNNWSIVFAFTIYLTKVRTFLQRKWDCSFVMFWFHLEDTVLEGL